MGTPPLSTERLILRPWRDEDLQLFGELNADERVMQHFPKALSREESDRLAQRIRAEFDERKFGLWAVEIPEVAPFIGFVGLSVPKFQAHFMPCVEIGWRLAQAHWGKGYATEAARAALEFGFSQLDLDEIVSFTAVENVASWRVMEKLGMQHDAQDDFDHPVLPEGHRLQRHVLYRMSRERFEGG